MAHESKKFDSFEKARKFARSLSLKRTSDWHRFCRGQMHHKGFLPSDIPAKPAIVYKDRGWKGWGDWLGSDNAAHQVNECEVFEKARKFARSLSLRSASDWHRFCRGQMHHKGFLPPDIPAKPDVVYKDNGWKGWSDWLGSVAVAGKPGEFEQFENARRFARRLGLKNIADWRKFCKGSLHDKGVLPSDIPLKPDITYRNSGWTDWGDWLGIADIKTKT